MEKKNNENFDKRQAVNDAAMEINLQEIVIVLLKRWWIIALSTIVCACAAFGYFYRNYTPTYTATAKLYVNATSGSLSLSGTKVSVSAGDISTAKSLVSTYVEILKTHLTLDEVKRQAKEKYGYELDYYSLLGKLNADAVNETEIFYVSIADPNPEKAINITNIIVDVLPDQISQVITGASVSTVDRAEDAIVADPGITRQVLIGAVVGFAIAAAAIVFIDYIFNDKIQNTDWLRAGFDDIPVLAEIPDANMSLKDSRYYRKYYKKYYKKNNSGGNKDKAPDNKSDMK